MGQTKVESEILGRWSRRLAAFGVATVAAALGLGGPARGRARLAPNRANSPFV